MKKRAIIAGTGENFLKYKDSIERKVDIVGVADRKFHKEELDTSYMGYKIIQMDLINTIQFDRIIIPSVKYYHEIEESLIRNYSIEPCVIKSMSYVKEELCEEEWSDIKREAYDHHVFLQGAFNTIWRRPKRAIDVVVENDPLPDHRVGIIIQGPLKLEDDFTVETVKLYQNIFPGCVIVVSTWKGEDLHTLQQLRETGCCVITSDLCEPGILNDNLQAKSTLAGILEAKKNGCEYILKTRCDTRIYQPNIIRQMIMLIKKYPLKLISNAHERIVAANIFTMSDRCYNISDLFLFGNVRDMHRYFNCPMDTRILKIQRENVSEEDFSKQNVGEIWFTSHYIESCGYQLQWTLEDSNFYRNELFIIIDAEMIDLYFAKYTDIEYRLRKYDETYPQKEVRFLDWLESQYVNDISVTV